jgi:phosphatidyl-myo-inositol dimannoside synthase
MFPSSPDQPSTHFWIPNIFEFKGGIQVYLKDVLTVLSTEFPCHHFHVFDKLDRQLPQNDLYADNFSFTFSGSINKFWQTPHYIINLILGACFQRPNLILCGLVNFSPVALLLHKLFGIPYWIIAYGIDVWDVTDPFKIQALRHAQKVISIGQYTRNRLMQEQHLAIDQIPLLPVTFDASRFAIGPKPDYLLTRYGLQPEQPTILTVTRLAGEDRYKGYDQILQALPQIRKLIPQVHYLLVGKGDDRPRIEQMIADLEMQDCVTLAGFIPDQEICDHYNLCDVFAMPSKGEGFGIVYLEALACGKPTLGGNQDGAIDALCNGELGVLINPDDIEAIAQTLSQILQKTYPHPLIYQPQALRQKAIKTFGFEKFQQTLSQLLATQGFTSSTQLAKP